MASTEQECSADKAMEEFPSPYLTNPSRSELANLLSDTDGLSRALKSGYLIPSESLDVAIGSGLTEAIALILEDGRIAPTENILLSVVNDNNSDVLRLLLQDGRVDPANVLPIVAYRGLLDMLDVLLYDPRVIGRLVDDTLLVAVEEEELGSVEILLESGKCTDEGIRIALLVSVQEGYSQEMVNVLRRHST